MSIDPARAMWRKSSRSTGNGNCVEVAGSQSTVVGVRDSKDPSGPALEFGPTEWAAFLAAVKGDQLR